MNAAGRVVETAQQIIAERLANQQYRRGDWSDGEAADRYFAVEGSLAVWEQDARHVVVTVVDTSDGRLWGFMASEVLDRAADVAGVDFDTALITQADGSTGATLSW